MDEEKIFGPLTFRQFLYASAGFILCYFIYTNLELKMSIPIIILIAGASLALVLNAPKIVIDENYLKIKKSQSKSPEEFERWIQRRIAIIQSQISMREQKGMKSNPELEALLVLLTKTVSK